MFIGVEIIEKIISNNKFEKENEVINIFAIIKEIII